MREVRVVSNRWLTTTMIGYDMLAHVWTAPRRVLHKDSARRATRVRARVRNRGDEGVVASDIAMREAGMRVG